MIIILHIVITDAWSRVHGWANKWNRLNGACSIIRLWYNNMSDNKASRLQLDGSGHPSENKCEQGGDILSSRGCTCEYNFFFVMCTLQYLTQGIPRLAPIIIIYYAIAVAVGLGPVHTHNMIIILQCLQARVRLF